MSPDRFTTFDAAYVLGALSADDRQAYEEHLSECPECARSVRELAGMPGLLGKVPEELATAETGEVRPPDTLLPRLLRRARGERWRRRTVSVATAAVAVAACLALALVLVLSPSQRGAPVAEPTVTMTPLISVPLQAKVGVDDAGSTTRITMYCAYQDTAGTPRRYSLVLVGKDGRHQRLTTWSVAPGENVRFQGSTSWNADDISAVEIRSSDGTPLLRTVP